MMAASQPREVVEFLVAQGADVNAVADANSMNHVGRRHSVLDWYRQQRNQAGSEVLERAGARTAEELRRQDVP